MAERRRSGMGMALAAGVIIGAVEVVLAVAFAAFVFGGQLVARLPDAIGLYLVAAAVTLAILAWRAGRRGVVGSVQDAAAAVLGGVAAAAVAKATQIAQIANMATGGEFEAPDIFLTVIAATLVVTVLCGVVFLALGVFRVGDLARFVPYPVVGGFLAGTGWLLFKGGIYVASGIEVHLRTFELLIDSDVLKHWLPAFAFGVILLLAVRRVKKPLVIPIVLAAGVAAFAIGVLTTGSGLEEVKAGRWLLGPFESARLWEPWTLRALSGADWSSVLGQWAAIATAIFVASFALLFNIAGTEVVVRKDLDTNRELRDAGVVNVVSGALGGIPGYHALSLTALAARMSVNARVAGLIACLVPLAAVIFGASVVELIPRMIVGGVLVFLGLAFITEWVWDKRRSLPIVEYVVVWAILATVIGTTQFLPGVVLGIVLAVLLFAINYGRIELVRALEFGDTFHSNVDRPLAEREAIRSQAVRVLVLRVHGFVFFGTASGLLERIRTRLDAGGLRYLVVDLRRVTGLDASAVVAFAKIARAAETHTFEAVLTGASETVRAHLERGGVAARDGVVRFEPDFDRGLQVCEEGLLAGVSPADEAVASGMPEGLAPHLERIELSEGAALIRQGEEPGDVFVLESGRLGVELTTAEGTRMRMRTIRPGVVVGEIALYTGEARSADVVADRPSVVLRLGRASIERIEAEDPELAEALHRWLATTVAERLRATQLALAAQLD